MKSFEYFEYDCIVIGTGAAGYNAAIRITEDGRKTVAVVSENVKWGTSRNTGSDKQTYYKLGLGGDAEDSVRKMAENLFSCGCVDGDNALCEAALSPRCFMNLCELGVPFPVNRYGEYVGYKTDHDPYARATSAGPLTSKFMTEALEKKAAKLNIRIFDNCYAVKILKSNGKVCGLLCVDTVTGRFTAFRSSYVILATGGPGGIYADSVYPECHTGSAGLALEAGASFQNMTEWQYGLASVSPRWNVSGTYMQVLPRFVSVDESGVEREFLGEYFKDKYEALSFVFLKGYQWPFDSRKVLKGSSVIDLLVYIENVIKKRKVYLDYRKNPFGIENIEFEKLSEEAFTYLKKAEATFGTPLERLLKMNSPAVDLYMGKGVDLSKEMLEIALCAQHNNGGIAVNLWWQTDVEGLFAAGECAGTHGITRPGGSALNAGQVGSLRAAAYICAQKDEKTEGDEFEKILASQLDGFQQEKEMILSYADGKIHAKDAVKAAQRRMSDCGGAIRNNAVMMQAIEKTNEELENICGKIFVGSESEVYLFYKLKDMLRVQRAYLSAMADYFEETGATRGSSLCTDAEGELRDGLPELFRFKQEKGGSGARIQELKETESGYVICWRNVREIPDDGDFFENVWRGYRENGNVY